MLCYVVGVLLILAAIITVAIDLSYDKGNDFVFAIIVSIFLLTGISCIYPNATESTYFNGVKAATKLEIGSYTSLEEINELIDQVAISNNYLEKAKANAHPLWNGHHMEKVQNYDYIVISEETKRELQESITDQFASKLVNQLNPSSTPLT